MRRRLMWPLWCEHRQPRGRALAPGPHTQRRQILGAGDETRRADPPVSGQAFGSGEDAGEDPSLQRRRARDDHLGRSPCAISVLSGWVQGPLHRRRPTRTAPHRDVARARQQHPDEDHTWLPGPERPAAPHRDSSRQSQRGSVGLLPAKSSPAESSGTACIAARADRPMRADHRLDKVWVR